MSSSKRKLGKLCRLCAGNAEDWQSNGSNNLFDKSNAFFIQQIKDLTGLTFKDGPRQMLPRYICLQCREDLPQAWEFRSKIFKTQSYFKSNDYKRQFEAFEDADERPAFAFVPLNEYDSDEEIETKSFLDDFQPKRSNSIAATEVSIKQEASDAQSIKNEAAQTAETKNTRKVKIRTKSLNEIPSKSAPNDSNSFVDCAQQAEFSDDSSTNETDNSESKEDPDFIPNIPETKQKQVDATTTDMKSNSEEPDILKNRNFCCHLCQCPLESLVQLKIHFQKQHKKEKYKCDLCDEKLLTIKGLVRHFRMHNGEKEHKCHFCDMTFKYSTIRCRHERRVHSKDPPFLCFYCGKTFITTSMGNDHMTVHTKERAFHCTVCKADFLRKSHLNTHYRSMTHKNNLQKVSDDLSARNSHLLPEVQQQILPNSVAPSAVDQFVPALNQFSNINQMAT